MHKRRMSRGGRLKPALAPSADGSAERTECPESVTGSTPADTVLALLTVGPDGSVSPEQAKRFLRELGLPEATD